MTTLNESAKCFDELAARIEKVWCAVVPKDKTFLEVQGWPHIALTPEDAALLAKDIATRIRKQGEDLNPDYWEQMASQAKQITFANFSSDPNQVSKSTFDFLTLCSLNLPTRPADVNWDKVKSQSYIPRELSRRITSMEGRLKALEPRAETVQAKIEAIEAAHDAADRLPTDMEELRRSNSELRLLLSEATKNAGEIERNLGLVGKATTEIERFHAETATLVQKCNENYRITTSAGLAAAFDQRSKTLSKTAWVWVAILAVALVSAVVIGSSRLDSIKGLLTQSTPTSLIILNILVAIVGVGGPVWLAWLATRNIGQSFKLSEDYAFKASISKAYEGYRKEAVNLDVEFAKRLFGSALTRLDEAPSRFISERDHNSPMEALLDSPAIKAFIEAFPEVREKLASFVVEQKGLLVEKAVSTLRESRKVRGAPEAKEES
ncbi:MULTISPECIES: hypothetical protein [unclassified Sinorhizobium]|uniref:hypothetical protein n=1 Tax=unclassified Sinorhizobium TaxID=2613772 RepID=UPI0024C37AF6|nr:MULTISPECIES: hypothetical protein [unclassified Sinorhizobium]MDK1376154.1 hypothetical protein [Sinorhizobium sp. 6-70]MDK1480309.1 hypothetical protein [Sinorhizobium sp. 6-117]